MRNLALSLCIFFIAIVQLNAQCDCLESNSEMPRASLMLCDNFQGYNSGNFPVSSSRWSLWPGTNIYGKIQAPPDNPNNKALFIQPSASGIPDVLLKLGNQDVLRYRLSWRIFIPAGKSASYSVLHDENVRTEQSWAFHVSFGTNGIGSIKVPDYDKEPITYFPYLTGSWNKIMHIIDISNDKVELWINDEFIDSWKFSLADVGNFLASNQVLGAVNFYPESTNSAYYLDNVCMWTLGDGTIKPQDFTKVCIKNGTSDIIEYAQGLGLYTVKEFTDEECREVCDFGGLNVNNAESNAFYNQYKITKRSLLPNQILSLDCVQEAFPLATKKQLRGVVSSYVARSEKLYINVIKPDHIEYEDFFVVLYDCENRFCIGKSANESYFDVVEGREYKIIILTIKEVEFSLDIRDAPCPGQCIVDFGVCGLAEDLAVNTTLTNLKLPEKLTFPKARLFEGLQNDYLGHERAFRFFVEKEGIVNIRLTSLGLGYCLFLTGNSCGFDLLEVSETRGNGGTATISRRLAPGIYHILIDQLYFNPEHAISFECIFSDLESVRKPTTEICPFLNESPHVVRVRANPLLLDGEPLTLNDRIYLFNRNNINNREVDGLNWNGQEIQFVLKADANPFDNKNCGYSNDELIEFKIIRNNKIYYVRPVFQVENGNEVTASNRFKRSGKSLITGFHSGSNYDDFGVGSFPSVSSSAKQFVVEVNYRDAWRFERFNNRLPSWIKTIPSLGFGTTDVRFEVSANTTTKTRADTLFLVNEEGFYKTIIINQPGCTGPSVTADLDQTVCANQLINLTATGVGTISWRTPTGNTVSGTRLSSTVTSTQTFTAIATLNGCTATDEVKITVSSGLNANAGLDQTICPGSNTTLTASGGTVYRWSSNQTGAQIPVSPTQTTTYTVTVSQNGCEATDQVVVNVTRTTASAGPGKTICAGSSVDLIASGGGTYRWSTNETSSSISVKPPSSQTYRVTVTNNGCSAEASVAVTVLSAPIASINPVQPICEGQSVLLTANGVGTYRWSGNNATSAQIRVAPPTNTIYEVSVTQGGCTSTATVLVRVNSKPTASAGPDKTICAGSSLDLNATGGGTYRWSTNEITSSIRVKPTFSQTYQVTVSNNGCSAEASVAVTVLPPPAASINPVQPICEGQSVLLTANGVGTYRWSGINATSAQIRVAPPTNTIYEVSVTQGGCTSTATVLVRVNPKPIANAGLDKNICQGEFTTLSASGGETYIWSTGSNAAVVNVRPSSTQTYGLTVTTNGCTDTDSITVFIRPKPVVTLAESRLIFGPTGFLKMNVSSGTPGYRYQWFRNDTLISTQKDLFGLRTGIYKLMVTDAIGCTATFGPQAIVTTSTIDPTLNRNIQIFPNPSTALIHIQFDLEQTTPLEINILDGLGKSIWHQNQRNFFREKLEVDLSNHPAGMYWVQFKTENGAFYKKIMRL